MKRILYNAGYFVKEVKTVIRLNLMSNIFSFLSTGLIFFILAMMISGWWVSSQIVRTIQGEAEINVYFREDMDNAGAVKLAEEIKDIDGVIDTRLVNAEEAYGRMEEILGKEARVLEYFDDNPFSPFIEVKIQIEEIDPILKGLGLMTGIEHVRDNREVLERLRSISEILKVLGYLIITAAGISTTVIISHIIRMGIYDSREQINTLRLMGAPEAFIGFPFMLEGLLLTLGGGALASVLAFYALKYVYAQVAGPLPFIPLPPREVLTSGIVMVLMFLSAVLGAAGSFFGMSSSKIHN
ncbi:MAG: permease-like cell division protein FtsX [Clostridiaceae bacterium]|jgi:cell division transport system permease protein|nr:permease-like cell division protein FtsX [Clostridiaceae bacterium]